MIKLENIQLSFAEKTIFFDLNVQIKKNNKVCLSCSSGKGKSTLLRMLQGFVLPEKGKVYINGLTLNTNNIKAIRENTIWIPQNINLPVNNGVELCKLIGVNMDTSLIKEYIQSLGLEELAFSEDFSKLSGGQKQRIVIAIGLSMSRELVLMDEPTASLDEESISKLINLVQSLKGKTIVSASHNQTWLNNMNQIIKL